MARIISIFEHERLKVGEKGFTESHLNSLERYYGEKGCPYFELIHNGVRFCEYVGVLKVGNLAIEVLPKIDKQSTDTTQWQGLLIDMLRKSGVLNPESTSSSDLRLRSNAILKLYMELFVSECEALMHKGLIKRYQYIEENSKTLKGKIVFSKHINKNMVHKERFYVNHIQYDYDHILNSIILKTIKLLLNINSETGLVSRLNNLLLNFPEVGDPVVLAKHFDINYNRKNEVYKKSIAIARLFLLNFHPDIRTGREHVLALMFDMNFLWESYIKSRLQRMNLGKYRLRSQHSGHFWTPESGNRKTLRPDFILESDTDTIIIDTKWKTPEKLDPSDEDLRQMFAYNHRFKSTKSILLYPGTSLIQRKGQYFSEENGCMVVAMPVVEGDRLDETNLKEFINILLE